MGSVLLDMGRLDEAEASYRRALQIKPDYAEALNNLGLTLPDMERLDEAEASYLQALQIKPSCTVLALLAERGLLTQDTCAGLVEAYDFLRRVEHRLQYLDDAQTHNLPSNPEDQQRVALSMGFADYVALIVKLDAHRAFVSLHFSAVFDDPNQEQPVLADVWQGADGGMPCQARLSELGYSDADAAAKEFEAIITAEGCRSADRIDVLKNA